MVNAAEIHEHGRELFALRTQTVVAARQAEEARQERAQEALRRLEEERKRRGAERTRTEVIKHNTNLTMEAGLAISQRNVDESRALGDRAKTAYNTLIEGRKELREAEIAMDKCDEQWRVAHEMEAAEPSVPIDRDNMPNALEAEMRYHQVRIWLDDQEIKAAKLEAELVIFNAMHPSPDLTLDDEGRFCVNGVATQMPLLQRWRALSLEEAVQGKSLRP